MYFGLVPKRKVLEELQFGKHCRGVLPQQKLYTPQPLKAGTQKAELKREICGLCRSQTVPMGLGIFFDFSM